MKPSRFVYFMSGGFGCLPSLVLFIFAVSQSHGHFGFLEHLDLLVFSLGAGILGFIGLITASVTRGVENRKSTPGEGADE